MRADYRRCEFACAAGRLVQMPDDVGAEAAFAGRSNAGKSSAINALTGRRALARTSKTPGRTQTVNFFTLDAERRLVNLPGYGFAKAPPEAARRWAVLVESYLRRRQSLAGLVLLTDARRPLAPLDRDLLAWCRAAGVPVHVALTKADKLSRGAAARALDLARRDLEALADAPGAQLFSATAGTGLDALAARLDAWLGLEIEPAGAGDGQKKAPALHSGGKGRSRGE